MKKTIKLTSILLVVVMLFASCAGSKTEQSKTITISIPLGQAKPVWDEVAKEYMSIHKDVKVNIEDKEGETYANWLTLQLSGESTPADIVISNEVTSVSNGKFLSYSPYLYKSNPYNNNKPWMDCLENGAALPAGDGEVYQINTDTIMTCFFYNKEIFEKVGVKVPKTWNELIAISDKLKSAGYIPLSTAGDAQGFFVFMMGWLFRVYTDQYFRDMEDLVLFQPTDYGYDEELFENFKFNKDDKFNDDNKDLFNMLRLIKLIQEEKIGPMNPKYKEMITNFTKYFPKYVQEGFLGSNNDEAISNFVTGKAAMWIDSAAFGITYKEHFKNSDVKEFEVGSFNYPAMEGNVGVDYTRTVGGSTGYYSIIKKSKEQNELNIDFMMFYASKKGQDLVQKKYKELGLAPSGPSLIKDVKLDPTYQEMYDSLGNPGFADKNIICTTARGFCDDLKSVRSFQDNIQELFGGKITVDQYCQNMQKATIRAIPSYLQKEGYRLDAVDDLTKNPLAAIN